MHKRDLRKLITNFDSASEFAAKYFPRAWPSGPDQVREHILECCRRMMNDDCSTAFVSGGIYINKVDSHEFEVWVDPTPWKKAEDKSNAH